jgi:hypothetical protein
MPTTYVEKSSSAKACPSNSTLCLLKVAPSLWCVSLFTTTFLFLLKKKSEGGISSIDMGVRSSMNITSACAFPLVNCNGVTNWMGLPISMDDCFSTAFLVDLTSVDNDLSSPLFFNISD